SHRRVAQPGRALPSGGRGRRFKSCFSDHFSRRSPLPPLPCFRVKLPLSLPRGKTMLQDRLVAHRGFQKAYPENTLLAHRMAIAAGAHFIETDIQFSADSQPVLYHDLAMKRLSGVENLVSNLTLAELARIPLHEPGRFGERYLDEPIAPLGDLVDLLAEHAGVGAFVEIKRSALQFAGLDKTLDILLAQLAPVAEQAVLISF